MSNHQTVETGMAMARRAARSRRKEGFVKMVFLICASMAIFAVLLIIVFVFKESIPAVKDQGFNLFTTNWSPNVSDPSAGSYGMLAFINGTLMTTLGGMVLGAPLGIGAAVFVDQIAPRRIGEIIARGIELLAGIPSVIIGWFGLILLVPWVARVTGSTGYGVLSASIVLTVMVLPTITALSTEALRALPPELKEASLGMGATRWQTVYRVLIPAARRGILISVILGIGRAIGETMAVQMVVGNARQMTFSLTERTSTLTSRIITDIGESTGVFRSALFAQGLVLLLIAMLLIIAVKFVSREKVSYK